METRIEISSASSDEEIKEKLENGWEPFATTTDEISGEERYHFKRKTKLQSKGDVK